MLTCCAFSPWVWRMWPVQNAVKFVTDYRVSGCRKMHAYLMCPPGKRIYCEQGRILARLAHSKMGLRLFAVASVDFHFATLSCILPDFQTAGPFRFFRHARHHCQINLLHFAALEQRAIRSDCALA